MVQGSDFSFSVSSLKCVFFFRCYPTVCDRGKCKRYFVANANDGKVRVAAAKPESGVFGDEVIYLLTKMITNLQILTEDDEVVHCVVDTENRITTCYQNIRRIPRTLIDDYGNWVEIMDFSHNSLRDVEELGSAFRLHTLILDHNLITSDSFFPWMPQLRVLWLNNNLIFDLRDFIPALSRACPNLVYLSLMGNAAASNMVMGGSELEQCKYRQYVISYFDQLRHLDDKPVTTIDRLRCGRANGTIMNNMLSVYKDVKSIFRLNLRKRSSGVV